MNVENRIKRHGRRLMSLASLGIACVCLLGLCLVAMPWLHDWNPQSAVWSKISGLDWSQVVRLNGAGKVLVAVSNLFWTLAYLLPLVALRHLGNSLYRQEALTLPIATAFRWLAHSMLANIVLLMAAGFLIAMAEEAGQLRIYHSTFDVRGDYMWVIACICLYSVAHLMRLATEAADDARSIV
ncbi:MAG TPA: hypothetical protein VFI32_01420 [Rhodanobacteraceae bacterium]|nr:hypothetical protein [Rhodanobacteraceae bacterium]